MQNSRFFKLNLGYVLDLNFINNVIFWHPHIQENIFSTLMIIIAALEAALRAP